MNLDRKRTIDISGDDIVDILFRNLSGAPDNFNRNGCTPNFWIVLKEEKAHELQSLGLNVRWKPNRDGDEEPRLQVFARYEPFPPKIYKVTSRNTTLLDEETVKQLDYDEIAHLDLVISPYHWENNGNQGVKAYISRAYFTIVEDSFSTKYDLD